MERYASNERRGQLLDGLRAVVDSLHVAGCARVYLNGSFVTDKVPGDFDACSEAGGVDPALLDAVLLDFSALRATQKAKYGGELLPAEVAAEPGGHALRRYFQRDRTSASARASWRSTSGRGHDHERVPVPDREREAEALRGSARRADGGEARR